MLEEIKVWKDRWEVVGKINGYTMVEVGRSEKMEVEEVGVADVTADCQH